MPCSAPGGVQQPASLHLSEAFFFPRGSLQKLSQTAGRGAAESTADGRGSVSTLTQRLSEGLRVGAPPAAPKHTQQLGRRTRSERGSPGTQRAHSGHPARTPPPPAPPAPAPSGQHRDPRDPPAGRSGAPQAPPGPRPLALRPAVPGAGRGSGGAAGSRCRAGRGLTSVLQRAREPHGDGADQRLAGAVDDAALAQADLEELHLPHGRAALLRSAGSGACPAEPCRALQSPAEPYRAVPAPPSLPRPGGSALHPPPPGPARAEGAGGGAVRGRALGERPGSGGKEAAVPGPSCLSQCSP